MGKLSTFLTRCRRRQVLECEKAAWYWTDEFLICEAKEDQTKSQTYLTFPWFVYQQSNYNCINPSWPSDVIWRHWFGITLVQVMGLLPDGNKPLSEQMFTYHRWGPVVFMWHDDVIKWKHFPRNWPFVRGIHRSRWIPHTKPVTRSFDVFFDLRLNKRLSKQWWGWWTETLLLPLCRHRNEGIFHKSYNSRGLLKLATDLNFQYLFETLQVFATTT